MFKKKTEKPYTYKRFAFDVIRSPWIILEAVVGVIIQL